MSSKLTQEKKLECYPKNNFYSLNRVSCLGSKNNYSFSINNLRGIIESVARPYIIFLWYMHR